MKPIAHTRGASGSDQDLVDHLSRVAKEARELAARASPERPELAQLAEWAGWLHDLGKFRPEFQDYIRGRRARGPETQHALSEGV